MATSEDAAQAGGCVVYVIFAAVAFILLLCGLDDYEIALNEVALYCDGVERWRESDGLEGWPNYNGLTPEQCAENLKKLEAER